MSRSLLAKSCSRLRTHAHEQKAIANLSRVAFTLIAAIRLHVSSHAQVIQQWTHQSNFGESSAVVAMDDNYMFVADNEDEILRLYPRSPEGPCAPPVYSFNFHSYPYLSLSSIDPEADLEAAVKTEQAAATRIYWVGSHSNSKTGKLRPNRYRLFATDVSGDGKGSTPYSLGYVGRYDNLRDDLIAWDRDNLHEKGATTLGWRPAPLLEWFRRE